MLAKKFEFKLYILIYDLRLQTRSLHFPACHCCYHNSVLLWCRRWIVSLLICDVTVLTSHHVMAAVTPATAAVLLWYQQLVDSVHQLHSSHMLLSVIKCQSTLFIQQMHTVSVYATVVVIC